MRRIRVVQVTHDLHPGGLPRVVDTLCRTIDPERFAVSVICLRDKGALADGLERDLGIPVHCIQDDPAAVDHLAFWKVRRVLEAHPADVLHTHNTEAFWDGGLGGFLARVPTLVHTDHSRLWPDRPLYMVQEHLLSYLAYRVVGCSESVTRDLRRYEKIPRNKLVTIPNGIEGERYDLPLSQTEARGRAGLPGDRILIGYASRLEPEKNASLLIRAFARIAPEVPEADLVVAGDGSERQELEALARQAGIENRVRFLGTRMDIPVLLKALDLHVLPSKREGLPMILLESMAAACPTIGTSVGGIPGVIRHGWNGELVASEDEEQLTGALLGIVRDPERRAVYGSRARETFRRSFDAKVMARRYELLYERRAHDLLNEGPGCAAPGVSRRNPKS